jgi:Zn-dependent M28 family amino/carboxypeptidase
VEKGFNVIAEIPGTDLKDEVVMVGAHLDSYTYAVGATDNAASVLNCLEVFRVIKSLGLQPRRTIRIGIWGAEEEGLFGSKHHIQKHFIKGNEKLFTYFNMDFGAGRFRGIYTEENSGAADVFKEWMKLIGDSKFQTVCLMKVKNSDQESFSDAGLSGFAFIQDPLDYYKLYHTNMDFVERVMKDDIANNSFLMTAFAWFSANAEGNFPVRAIN